MPSRRKTREFALQVLFAAETLNQSPLRTLEFLETHFGTDPEKVVQIERVSIDFARALISGVSNYKNSIDRSISEFSENWKLHRINQVDRNILRMAIAEMTTFPETPTAVILNEAIEIGKKYGAENSGAFINGVLDRIRSVGIDILLSPDTAEINDKLD
ncbi:MAG: transcription antitermination factor NusB [Deltaproteobacteria bacterium]|nr:transcription antitermination factor NusB [Deltaproteobacteria bacterium]